MNQTEEIMHVSYALCNNFVYKYEPYWELSDLNLFYDNGQTGKTPPSFEFGFDVYVYDAGLGQVVQN